MRTTINRPSIFAIAAATLAAASLMATSGAFAHNGPGGGGHGSNGSFLFGTSPVHGPGSSHNPIVYHPVHGVGSSHNPIVYHPVHGPGSSHNPIICGRRTPGCFPNPGGIPPQPRDGA